jgi:predicted AAA+ superfamily ATPase
MNFAIIGCIDLTKRKRAAVKMYSDLIKNIILSYQNSDDINLTQRDLKLHFIPNMALGIVGSRRCGKTFRTHQLAVELRPEISKENICRIQFNDHRVKRIPVEKLHAIDDAYYLLYPAKRDSEKVLFIFDEIHRIEGWEDYILYLLENRKHMVVITGSTATLLKGQFASQLRGKIFPVEEFTFSFREFLRHYKVEIDCRTQKGQSFLLNTFDRYMKQGGFPGLLDIPEKLHVELLRTYWDTMLLRDIIEAHCDKDINIVILRYFTDSLVSRISCPMSISKLVTHMKDQGFKFAKGSLYDYLSFLSDAYMVETVDFYSKSERVRARNYRKVYCIDWALARAVCHGEGIDSSRVLENIVFIELRRRGFSINYYRTKQGYEIDFVVTKPGGEIELIQVAYSIEDAGVADREIRAIAESVLFLKAERATIITYNEKNNISNDSISINVVPVWSWLLESQ